MKIGFPVLLRWNRVSGLAGATVWILLLLPLSGWFGLPVETSGETWLIERLLLLSVLVLTPLTLSLVATPAGDGAHSLPFRAAALSQPFAAILIVTSFYTRTGMVAALLTVGWILVTGPIALFGLWRMRQRWAARKSLLPMEELCIDAGLAYVTVGSGWLFLSRWGLNPLGFSDAIVLLTAVHFHYAGFAAPILTGFAGRKIGASIARKFYLAAAAGVIAGPPLVAAGITLSRGVEVFSAVILALSLFVLALLMLFVVAPKLKPRLAQLLLSLSAISVMVTMLFACLYAMGRFTGAAIVTLPLMAQVHGVSNAMGFVLCGLLAWTVNSSMIVCGHVHCNFDIEREE
jgi:hypothetical protein